MTCVLVPGNISPDNADIWAILNGWMYWHGSQPIQVSIGHHLMGESVCVALHWAGPGPLKCLCAPSHQILAKSAPPTARKCDKADFWTKVRKSSINIWGTFDSKSLIKGGTFDSLTQILRCAGGTFEDFTTTKKLVIATFAWFTTKARMPPVKCAPLKQLCAPSHGSCGSHFKGPGLR